jgi:hypothetical protein
MLSRGGDAQEGKSEGCFAPDRAEGGEGGGDVEEESYRGDGGSGEGGGMRAEAESEVVGVYGGVSC